LKGRFSGNVAPAAGKIVLSVKKEKNFMSFMFFMVELRNKY
jgi:hypothetical protein